MLINKAFVFATRLHNFKYKIPKRILIGYVGMLSLIR